MQRGSKSQEKTRGYSPRRRLRPGVLIAVGVLHMIVFAGLLRAFAPDLTASAVEKVTSVMSVTITAPEDPPAEPSTAPVPEAEAGASAEEGPKAIPREVVAPKAPIPRPSAAPRAASTGAVDASGARDGPGTGGGGAGDGTGNGRGGNGAGGGLAVTKPEKIAGEINDARDYPVPPGGREVRRGKQVVIYMTVGADGRARDCRVVEPSPDAEADRITCRLAEERFRFRPARDADGNAVPAPYGWRQRWF